MPNQPNDYPDSTPLDQEMTDIEQWSAKVERMRQQNNDRFAKLEQQGTPVNPMSILHTRLAFLCDAVLGTTTDSSVRLQFEEKLQNTYREALDGLEAQVRKAQLTAPLQQPNGNRLIIP